MLSPHLSGTPRASIFSEARATKNGLALLGGALLCLQLLLCERISFDDLRFTALCAVALGAMLWPRRDTLILQSDFASSLAGIALIGFFLRQSIGQPGTLFASIGPLIWGLGFALLASGARGLGQFWREGIILAAIVVTPFIETIALDLAGVDLAPTTAQFTAFLLRLGGWDASSRNVLVGLPEAWVVVSQGCSGLKTMYFLGGFAVLVLLMFPLPGWRRKIGVILGALAIGFLVNALRVALLALLAPKHQEAFRFFHIKQGAMVFEVIAIIAFVFFFYLVIPTKRSKPAAPTFALE